MEKDVIDWIVLILLIVGGVNWGLVGLFDMDLVQVLFGGIPVLADIVYILVGLSGLYAITYLIEEGGK